MNGPTAAYKYTGATPGADSTERTLFDTPAAFGGTRGAVALAGLERVQVFVPVSHVSTLKFYWSSDGGTTYVEDTDYAQSIPATSSKTYDFVLGPYAAMDFKITHTNGGSAQTTWAPRITLSKRDLAA